MKLIARWLLRLVTLVVPVVIAACYGPPTGDEVQGYYKQGKVVDKQTRKGISGIVISCLRAGEEVPRCPFLGARSGEDGYFGLAYSFPCDFLRAEQCPLADGSLDSGAEAPVGADASNEIPSAVPDGGLADPTRRYKSTEVPFDRDAPTILIEMEPASYQVVGE